MAKNKKKNKHKKKLPTVRLNERSTHNDIIKAVKDVYFNGEKPSESDKRAAFNFLVGILIYNLDKSMAKK